MSIREIKVHPKPWPPDALEDPRRKRSVEVDFGVHWRPNRPRVGGETWRISWIEDTGELYAIQLVPEGKLLLLTVVPTREEVERLLEGWAEKPLKIGLLLNPEAWMLLYGTRRERDPVETILSSITFDDVPTEVEDASPVEWAERSGVYRLYRDEDGIARANVRLRLKGHEDFEWGYMGSGPHNLALTILEAELRRMGISKKKGDQPSKEAWVLHHNFVEDVISQIPLEGGTLLREEIEAWLRPRFIDPNDLDNIEGLEL